jgi:hypothetical protein
MSLLMWMVFVSYCSCAAMADRIGDAGGRILFGVATAPFAIVGEHLAHGHPLTSVVPALPVDFAAL